MTVLAKNYARPCKLRTRMVGIAPVNAGSKIFVGSLVCREAATGVVIPAADTANVVCLGIAVESMFPDDPDLARLYAYDNTNGADGVVNTDGTGERCIRFDGGGLYLFVVEGSGAKVGDPVYVVDNNTVGLASEVTNLVLVGRLFEPGPVADSWYVKLSFAETFAPLQESADITDFVAITGGQSPTEAEFNALGAQVNDILDALRAAGILV